MILRGTVIDQFTDKPLGELKVSSDSADLANETIQRMVVGELVSETPYWDDFLRAWEFLEPYLVDGVPYMRVRNIQVDYDCYVDFSGVHFDRSTRVVRLLLLENFYEGDVEDYYTVLRERNAVVANRIAQWDEGRITRNDVRIFAGLAPIDSAAMDEFIDAEMLKQLREVYLDGMHGFRWRTNSIS